MSDHSAITPRRPRIVFSEQIDRVFLEGQPELSYLLLGLSLQLPYGEPYMIRAMNKAKRHVTDPKLREAISLFNAQEGQHFRLHKRFNKTIGASCPALAELEAELARDYDQFLSTRSLKWNLAYIAAVEAVGVELARFLLEEQLLRDAHPAVRDLFEWHALEELEHRSVALDVYDHLYGGYAYRVAVGVRAQRDFFRFTLRAMAVLLEQHRAAGRELGSTAQVLARVGALSLRSMKSLVPNVVATLSPRYAPERISMPATAGAVLERLAGWDPVAELAASASKPALAAGAPA